MRCIWPGLNKEKGLTFWGEHTSESNLTSPFFSSFFVCLSSCLQGKIIKGVYRFHAVITTFEMILTDCPELRSVPWRCVVIDEAHRLKNRNCKLLEGLKMMDMVSGGYGKRKGGGGKRLFKSFTWSKRCAQCFWQPKIFIELGLA